MTEQDRAIMVKNHARWLAFNAGVPWDMQDVIDCNEFWEQAESLVDWFEGRKVR